MYQTPQFQPWYWFNVQKDFEEKYEKVCMVVSELSEVIKHLEKKIIEMEHCQEEPRKTKFRRKCKFFNSGFCKRREDCRFEHPESLCETFQGNVKCPSFRTCPHRHPKVCRDWKVGKCFRGEICLYLHQQTQKEEIAVNEMANADADEMFVNEITVNDIDVEEFVADEPVNDEMREKEKKLVTLEINGQKIVVSDLFEVDKETFELLSLDDISKFYLDDFQETYRAEYSQVDDRIDHIDDKLFKENTKEVFTDDNEVNSQYKSKILKPVS